MVGAFLVFLFVLLIYTLEELWYFLKLPQLLERVLWYESDLALGLACEPRFHRAGVLRFSLEADYISR